MPRSHSPDCVSKLSGRPQTEPLPPEPPVGISVSVSLSGEPARVDMHVPFKAIARIVQALKPQPPPA